MPVSFLEPQIVLVTWDSWWRKVCSIVSLVEGLLHSRYVVIMIFVKCVGEMLFRVHTVQMPELCTVCSQNQALISKRALFPWDVW